MGDMMRRTDDPDRFSNAAGPRRAGSVDLWRQPPSIEASLEWEAHAHFDGPLNQGFDWT